MTTFGRLPHSPRFAAVAAFVLVALAAGVVLFRYEAARIAHERVQAAAIGRQFTAAVQQRIDQALASTSALAALVKLAKGEIVDFELTAATLLSFYPGASALELAPDGVVREVVPRIGNERAIGHNLLADPARDKEAFLARSTGKLTLAGPFPLVQGGMGAAGRLPVFLEDADGKPAFWGFAVVLIRFPEMLDAARLPMLTERGYRYVLWRLHPDTRQRHVIAATDGGELIDPVDLPLQVPNATWTLSIVPAHGWQDRAGLSWRIGVALLLCVAAARIAWILHRQRHAA